MYLMNFKEESNIKLIEEKKLLGTGGGILNALEFLDEKPCLLMNADIYNIEIKNLFHHSPIKDSENLEIFGIANPNHNIRRRFFV